MYTSQVLQMDKVMPLIIVLLIFLASTCLGNDWSHFWGGGIYNADSIDEGKEMNVEKSKL
jgi:hypothetical protein